MPAIFQPTRTSSASLRETGRSLGGLPPGGESAMSGFYTQNSKQADFVKKITKCGTLAIAIASIKCC
jgi:hypothetical protein